ncbi:MAG: flavin reductase family protein [Dehalococcoidia bacterium]|nr:flavin reductase family protein [Dehalococcoidia bacterium]
MAEKGIGPVMDEMPYGLYIIGSVVDGEVNGMMADWVMQVSFSPRLLAVAFENDAHTLENIRANGVFTLNLLSQDHDSMELAAKFAQPYYDAKIKGRSRAAPDVHRKLEGIAHTKTASGCPVLEASMAWLECEAERFVDTGDHTVVIASIRDGALLREAEALTSSYTGWPYSG